MSNEIKHVYVLDTTCDTSPKQATVWTRFYKRAARKENKQ